MTITLSERNLDHTFIRHAIEKSTIESILASPDIITRIGQNVKYYYKDNLVVIIARETRHKDWYLKTAYPNEKPFLMGDIEWQKED